mmetsp:Transcript_47529/g.118781  ORF Transcript_47529/g.118781 Transcript_47529/m.118781 type:complete len:173 (-) Transcript_47529:427-945(-)
MTFIQPVSQPGSLMLTCVCAPTVSHLSWQCAPSIASAFLLGGQCPSVRLSVCLYERRWGIACLSVIAMCGLCAFAWVSAGQFCREERLTHSYTDGLEVLEESQEESQGERERGERERHLTSIHPSAVHAARPLFFIFRRWFGRRWQLAHSLPYTHTLSIHPSIHHVCAFYGV